MPQLQWSSTTLLAIIDALPIGVLVVDEKGRIVLTNFKIQELLGYTATEFCNLSVKDLVPRHLRNNHDRLMGNYLLNPNQRSMDDGRILSARMKNGEEVLVQLGLSPLTADGTKLVMVSMIETVNKILKVGSHSDPLTGLPNRTLFKTLSENLRNMAIRNQTSMALVFIDLDRFKQVNDLLGHDVGDRVLLQVANIFQKKLRKSDVAGRIGGDEFVICFYGIEDLLALKNTVNKLAASIAAITNIDEHKIDIAASIGLVNTNFPASITIEQMIEKADTLMYEDKQNGKDKDLHNKMS